MKSTTSKIKLRDDAKYLQLVNHFASQIRGGQLRSGDRLPTFVELQELFSVTSPTVNRAMIALEQQGLVERKRGSGVYATDYKARQKNAVIGLAGLGFQFGGRSSYWTDLLAGVREEAARNS